MHVSPLDAGRPTEDVFVFTRYLRCVLGEYEGERRRLLIYTLAEPKIPPDVGGFDRLVSGGENKTSPLKSTHMAATCGRPSFRTVVSLAVRALARRKLLYSLGVISSAWCVLLGLKQPGELVA
jgi:hypothetical protein